MRACLVELDLANLRPILAEYFSVPERRECAGLAERARPGWVAARMALKSACADLREPRAVVVSHDVVGRPSLPGIPGECSMAHCGACGAAVRAAGRVGIDLEAAGRFPAEFAELVATRAEIGRVAETTVAARVAARVWTLKESVLKAIGTGSAMQPSRITIESASHDGWRLSAQDLDGERTEWLVHVLDAGEWCVAVATADADDELVWAPLAYEAAVA